MYSIEQVIAFYLIYLPDLKRSVTTTTCALFLLYRALHHLFYGYCCMIDG
jgi:hypothetical protein